MIGKLFEHEDELHFSNNFEDYWADNAPQRMEEFYKSDMGQMLYGKAHESYLEAERKKAMGWYAFWTTAGASLLAIGYKLMQKGQSSQVVKIVQEHIDKNGGGKK